MLTGRRLRINEMMSAMGISQGSPVSTFNEHLDFRKLSAKRVVRLLTIENEFNPVTTSNNHLMMFKHNPDDNLPIFILVDETRLYHYTTTSNNRNSTFLSGIRRSRMPSWLCHRLPTKGHKNQW